MNLSFIIILLLGISFELSRAYPMDDSSSELEDSYKRELSELMEEKRAHEFLVEKRFIYTGKEQRREAKEKYEEKCKRKFINKMRNKKRWCPQLTEWPAWNDAWANAKAHDAKPKTIG